MHTADSPQLDHAQALIDRAKSAQTIEVPPSVFFAALAALDRARNSLNVGGDWEQQMVVARECWQAGYNLQKVMETKR